MTPTEARAWSDQLQEQGFQAMADALRSLADQVEASQWQPIETAPHNKRVLVFYTYTNGIGRRIIATYYNAETLESEYEESGYAEPGWYEESYAADTIYPIEQEPTHWMRLPSMPSLNRAREATCKESLQVAQEIDALRTENATLRELVREITELDPWKPVLPDWFERAEKALAAA